MSELTELKVANAVKWINELETTKERQGKGILGNPVHGYCCLGIGCTVVLRDDEWDGGFATSYEFKTAVGLNTDLGSPKSEYRDRFKCLTFLNDNSIKDFKGIGKMLKESPEVYFREEVAKGIINHYQNQ